MTYKMKLEIIAPNVFHVLFNKTNLACRTFMRFQEYYESQNEEFRTRPFSRKEFRDWYMKFYKQTTFTYEADWAGFNIPSYILKPFYDGDFDPLAKCEQDLLDLFKGLEGTNYYVIGSGIKGTDKDVLAHETAHGLWYTNKKYREAQQAAMANIPKNTIQKIEQVLKTQGYAETVMEDEVHAYLLASRTFLTKRKIKVTPIRESLKNMEQIYLRHAKVPLAHRIIS